MGSGSTFAAPVYTALTPAYNVRPGSLDDSGTILGAISYSAVGSGNGIKNLRNGLDSFAGSDYLPSQIGVGGLADASSFVSIPAFAG